MKRKELPRFGSGIRGLFRYDRASKRMIECDIAPKIKVNAPFVVTDEILPTLSMTGTDKVYTSKAKLRREYKERGFIETGGETVKGKPYQFDDEERREDVAKALNDIKYGMAPLNEWEKEICLREQREIEAEKKRRGI